MLSLADADPVVTVTLDPAEEGGATAAELSGEEPMVVVHRGPDSTTLPPPTSTATLRPTSATSNFHATTSHSAAMDNAEASLGAHSWLGLSTAASVLLGAEGGLRGAEGGIREQIHNRQNARDRAAKAAEGGCTCWKMGFGNQFLFVFYM